MVVEIPGLNVKSGLDLCDDNVEIYVSALRLYVSNIPPALDKARNVSEETLRNYIISVHGIKSTSEIIGAEEINKTAKELEAMGKAGDLAGIQARNSAFIKNTENLLVSIRNWLEKYDASRA